MSNEKQKLIIEQLDRRFSNILSVSKFMDVPSGGWISSLRKSLNISLKQLGKRLNVSSQNINQFEQREKEGTITLQKLREVAEALEMNLVYTFVPKEGSLDKMISRKALIKAEEIVRRTSHTMKLENQENSEDRIQNAINEKAEKIKNEIPRYLWD